MEALLEQQQSLRLQEERNRSESALMLSQVGCHGVEHGRMWNCACVVMSMDGLWSCIRVNKDRVWRLQELPHVAIA